MNKVFEIAFEKLMEHEGGYVNHPNDPGGETKYGISKRSYPDVDIKKLTKAKAKEIYKKDFWDKNRCDEMPIEVAIVVFLGTVNAGNASNKKLQQALGVKADGIIGNVTLGAINKTDSRQLAIRYSLLMYKRYTQLKTWKTFGKGWENRVVDTLDFALKQKSVVRKSRTTESTDVVKTLVGIIKSLMGKK